MELEAEMPLVDKFYSWNVFSKSCAYLVESHAIFYSISEEKWVNIYISGSKLNCIWNWRLHIMMDAKIHSEWILK